MMTHRLFCGVQLSVTLWLVLGLQARGAEAPAQGSQLLEQSWTPGSDNRQQLICALLETRQGYLWIGTSKGLVRFDGVRFTDFPFSTMPGMSGGRTGFAAMWEDRAGGVWAGTNIGVTHYEGGRFSSLTTRDGLPSNSVIRIDGDETGAVWIFTPKGVCRWESGTLRAVHPERDDGAIRPLITRFPSDWEDMSHMGLWRRSASDGLERFAYGRWREFPLPFAGKRHEDSKIASIYEDSLHRVWYSLWSVPSAYYEVAAGNSLVTYKGLPPGAFVFFRDRDGFLWLSDHQAHTARWKDGVLYPIPSLRTPYLTHMVQRADGGLWAGTFYTRLFLFTPRLITAINTPGTPEVGPVLFRQQNGTVWAASTELVRFKGDEGASLAHFGDTSIRTICTAIGEDRYGNLLFGDLFRAGVRTLKDGKVVPAPLYSSVTGVVGALLMDSAGDVWFGTSDGSFHAYAGNIHHISHGLPGTRVRCLLEAAPGTLWAGTDKGPALLSGENAEPFPWKFGAVLSLAKDPQGTIWIGTSNGIVRYADGKFRLFDQSDGLPTNVIYSADASDPAYLWLRTDAGLLRIGKENLLREPEHGKPELKITQFGEADGLPSVGMEPPGNQGVLHWADGTTWFSTLGGIAALAPGVLDRSPSRPHAAIEEHVIDASSLLSSQLHGIVVKPNETSLEIRYTALGSYHPEQVKFRYQLVGIDPTWVPVQHRRAAFYTHLRPGDYIFRVQAADGDQSDWPQPEAHIGVEVLTPFYRTWWMESLLVLILVSAIAIAVEMRRRQMLEAHRVRQAFTHRLISSQENERKRIAHELHDGLGQHLALIRTLALLPAKLQGTRGPEQGSVNGDSNSLSSIADQAATAIYEVEAICYDLRPYQLDRLGLTKAVRSLIRKLEEGNALFLRSSVDDIDGFFPPELEINFYRILQEAISNILRHSEATQAEIRVTCDGTNLRLCIEDNGRGFSPARHEAGSDSLGLIGIAERAEVLGGHATIESSEKTGTRVVVEVTRTRPIREGKQ